MNQPSPDNLLSDWCRVGVMFDVTMADKTPDLERLIIETARFSPGMARLFAMSATWLNRYGDLIARHRLRRMAQDLATEDQPVLGLLLDTAQQGMRPQRFKTITEPCAAWPGRPRPLFDAYRDNPALVRRLTRRASPLSRRWGLLAEPVALKPDAIRPPDWLWRHNPQLAPRADFRGDLRASIVAALRYDRHAGDSELALSRATGASRAQVRQDLDNLELSGRVRRVRSGNRCKVQPHRITRRSRPVSS